MAAQLNGTNQYFTAISPVVNPPYSLACICLENGQPQVFLTLEKFITVGSLHNWVRVRSNGLNTELDLYDQYLAYNPSIGTSVGRGNLRSVAAVVNNVGLASSMNLFSAGEKATFSGEIKSINQDKLVIGSRIFNNVYGQFLSGTISEAAIWSVALTDAEIASLAKGFSPRRIRPQSLVFYAPLLRNLQDLRKGLALTAVNSPTVANHPRVY